MAIPAFMQLFDDQNSEIKGGVKIRGRENTVEVLAFNHEVRIPTDPHSGALTGMRKHESLVILKKYDPSSPYLYKACCRGQTLKKVIIRWYDINESGAETEYFRHELSDVKVTSVKPIMHNVKDGDKERYPHLEEVSFRYAKVNWLYHEGGLEYTDSWNDPKTAL